MDYIPQLAAACALTLGVCHSADADNFIPSIPAAYELPPAIPAALPLTQLPPQVHRAPPQRPMARSAPVRRAAVAPRAYQTHRSPPRRAQQPPVRQVVQHSYLPTPAPALQAWQVVPQRAVARTQAPRPTYQVARARPGYAIPQLQHASYTPPPSRTALPPASYSMDQDFDTWSRVFNNFQLGNHRNNPRVQAVVARYAQNPAQLSLLSQRASLFLHMIIEEVNRRGMPAEVALLPFVESGFNPDIFSHAGAAGLWQFIPSTGRDYGLKQASSYDARLDPFAATGAALNYLDKLQRQFNGDWLLAFAAYNCGENRVERAIAEARRAGRPTNFWNLSLPRETMEYVPRLLAFKELIGNAERYGIRLPVTPNKAKLAQLRINKPVDLRQAALQAGLPADKLTALNPCFRTGITTPEHSNRIILPRDYAARLVQVIQAMPPAYAPRYAAYRRSLSYGS